MFKAKIVTIFLVPAVTFYALVAGLVYKGQSAAFVDLAVLKSAAIMSALCALGQDLIPREAKEVLVFWRLKNRLPGHRAFSLEANDRYDLSRITNIKSLKSLDEPSQQRAFYKLYKKHKDDGPVSSKSFRYIAWRDTSATFFFLAVLTVPVSCLLVDHVQRQAVQLAAFAAFAYLLTSQAARLMAHSLVSQVLSCETSEPPHAIT